MALGRRNPTDRLVHHADHGSQYSSVEFTNRLADWELQGSYGSVGDAFDNAAMETLWATLKKEIGHIWGPRETRPRHRYRRASQGSLPRRSRPTATTLAGPCPARWTPQLPTTPHFNAKSPICPRTGR